MDKRPYILGVDDDEYNRLIIEDVLEEEYEVSCVTNGQECLDAVQIRKPNLILLDVWMPVLDGLETCRKLKADPNTKDICILFLSALAREEDKSAGLEAGGNGYITKPINPDKLLEEVKQQCNR